MTDFVTITTTADDRGVADRIARAVIERRIAACARISSAESVYRWDGEICVAPEFVVEIKTTAAARAAVEAAIRELHSYELPEIVAHPVAGGSKAYLDWVSSEVAGGS